MSVAKTSPDNGASVSRFELELEFVQCLANPFYLHYLAQQDYFDDPRFAAYLEYLTYWRKPEYAKYPHCLHYLELLQHTEFRQSLRLLETARTLHGAQYKHWRFWRDGKQLEQ
ncbi:mediator complex, subunit Med31 [Syncephalis fuscata]|nr:mediator complex, subunit Med31 [Syncephalis fuscata]